MVKMTPKLVVVAGSHYSVGFGSHLGTSLVASSTFELC